MGKNIVLIQFSNRKDGNCSAIASNIRSYYHRCNVSIEQVSAKTMPACGECDYECLRTNNKCPNLTDDQTKLFDSVCNADLVYFIVPNYCGFPCANYYAFNERSVGYFNNDRALLKKYMSVRKRFVIVSNTEGQNFEAAAKQHTQNPEILYLKTRKYGKQSIAGDLMDSEDARLDLGAFLNEDTL